jgi:hypothetical protein
MPAEQRRDVRYGSSQKAVILKEGGEGRLCVITNLSKGGLCVAVVGSFGPSNGERIGVKVNGRTFLCNIVNRGKEGLHCRFEDSIGDPGGWEISPHALVDGRK